MIVNVLTKVVCSDRRRDQREKSQHPDMGMNHPG